MTNNEGDKQRKNNNALIYSLISCLGCGVILILSVIVIFGSTAWLFSGIEGEGGVRTQNQFEKYALDYIEENDLLNDDEVMLAYYDGTIKLTAEELVILTDKRIINHADRKTEYFHLDEIEDIQHNFHNIHGDRFLVASKTGEVIQFDIDLYNDGDIFLELFMDTWNNVKEKQN